MGWFSRKKAPDALSPGIHDRATTPSNWCCYEETGSDTELNQLQGIDVCVVQEADEEDEEEEVEEQYRYVNINSPQQNDLYGFCNNRVITARYTVFNFVPKILFYEFSKLANAYFLIISIMQTIKPISNTGGFPASLPALTIIILIDTFFAALEDYNRHLSDRKANQRLCQVLKPAAAPQQPPVFEDRKWEELVVGDMIKLHNREWVPADVVILAVSEADPENPTGICYVETKSLDGETNLKLRQGLECTYTQVHDPSTLAALNGRIVCEQPNCAIHRFTGTIRLEDGTEERITTTNILLRGCMVRNTEWVYAKVINTGPDTKIMMSSTESPVKWSNMEKRLNKQILYICGLMLILCLTGVIASTVWNEVTLSDSAGTGAWYLYDPDALEIRSAVGNFFVVFLYYFLLLNSFIPVSLYVSMTSVKFMQSYFMNHDVQMYHEESDTPCQVRSMSLNEELGQIDYIFSDKTGTLTCNVMDFRKCSIQGVRYGNGTTEIGLAAQRRMGAIDEEAEEESEHVIKVPFVNFDGPELLRLLQAPDENPEIRKQKSYINRFWEHLAVCHTVMPERVDGELRLSASSPDEQALVAGAACFGYSFVGRSPGIAKVQLQDKTISEYKILDVLEFNSTRKRMSVIVETPSKELVLLCKGADTVMYERLRNTSCREESEVRRLTLEHMEEFANEGLRTLVIASRVLDPEWYAQWGPRFQSSLNDMKEIQLRRKGEPNQIDSLMDEVETNLTILGATAIEDRLQTGVPATISKMRTAGIKVWMLTGDKEETAINIGFACELLTSDMERVVISAETHQDLIMIDSELKEHVDRIHCETTRSNEQEEADDPSQYALVIDGEALEIALEESPTLLLEFARHCRVVIACRVSPAQKASLVQLVRDNIPKARTLAIGDGANDVSMIQAAHIGVGISGQEGMQAVNSSDYAIAQFRFLQRLVLVHGRWNYVRMSKLIIYIFYKNVVMNLTQYCYMFFTGFSGQKFFLEWGLQGYNLIFTAVPIILIGTFEQDVPDHFAVQFPRLYEIGRKNSKFNTRVVWQWLVSCIWEAVVISLGTIYGMDRLEDKGATTTMWVYGATAFTIVVIVVNLKLAMRQHLWHWTYTVVYTFSIGTWLLIAYIISDASTLSIYWLGVFRKLYANPGFWLLLPLLVFVSLSRDIFWRGYKRAFHPSYRHLVQDILVYGLEDRADELLAWPPPSSIPTTTEDAEAAAVASKEKKLFPSKAMGRAIDKVRDAGRFVARPFLSVRHGFSFSYDAETVMAQSAMATGRFKNLKKAFQRHASRGSLAFRDQPCPVPGNRQLSPAHRPVSRRHTISFGNALARRRSGNPRNILAGALNGDRRVLNPPQRRVVRRHSQRPPGSESF